ncbi:TetR/AcrR family transcriptional regulator [Roseospira visakhapatnamensis]|uniref:AcrR family transcriptional regulator n=1 Tax=Roseospira visakhapatnamensis TaxID=390880 RepID=A0A7W6RGG0_9PROT|nr:TetR/AcrR family transcriptional regulator [Roseospira visakhapatnamensis]MBB4267997.1 AcrR family transcriptional regulator [Roseospira visakhapatnamensis]
MARRRLTPSQRRDELLEAADLLLQACGTALRVEDITTAAGAAKGTFYTCFKTWDDLLVAVRDRRLAMLEQRLTPLLDPTASHDWPPLLPRVAEVLVAFILDLGKLHDVLFHSTFPLTHPLPPEAEPATRFAALLRAGQAAGAYVDLDPEPTGALIFAMIHETADTIAAGANYDRAMRALTTALNRLVLDPQGDLPCRGTAQDAPC